MIRKIDFVKILLWMLLVSMIIPVLIGCFYAGPSADDFSNGVGWVVYQGNHLKYIFEHTIDVYFAWQGTYLGAFLAGIPVYYIGGHVGLRICLFLNALLFMISLYLFVNYSMKWLGIKTKGRAVILFYTIGIVYLFCNNNLDEIFYWYTGICVYTLPLSLMLLCFTCYIQYEATEKNRDLLLGCVLAFLAAGGSLDIAALLCAGLLFAVLYECFINGTIRKNAFIGVTAILGAVINTVAPGNFTRHSAIDEKIRPIQSSVYLILRINEIFASEIKKGFLLLIFIIAFLLAYKHLKNSTKKFKYPVLVSVYAYFAIIITDFPVALGYSGGYYMPERCIFVENLAIVIFVTLCAIYWGGWSSQKNIFRFTPENYLVIALILIIPLSSYLNLESVKELIPYKMTWHMVRGDYKRVCEREENILKHFQNAQEKDLTVYSEKEVEGEWTNLKKVDINTNSEYWVNRAIAEYYNLNTVKLEYTDK